MAKTSMVGKTATHVGLYEDTGEHYVQYHDTKVVRWDDEKIILDSGGWRTATTKLRMNQAANQFGLGFNVYQRQSQWFVFGDFGGSGSHHVPFEDGMVINRGGRKLI